MTPIHLGISTCPNDTFAFHGILEGKVDPRGLDFRVELLDVEELNRRLFAGDFDVAKASFHAALLLSGDLGVLPVGSALGFGVGPLLLAASPGAHPRDPAPTAGGGSRLLAARPGAHPRDPAPTAGGGSRPARVLCPGAHTTAALLYELFHAGEGAVEQAVFSDIMPALASGEADFGVCIHEGRFTWRAHGLALVEDLGTVWEAATDAPLPLGGILARHALGPETIGTVTAVIRDSLAHARAHRAETVPTMRRHAQELSDEVMFQHVDLYVNEWTTDLGDTGRTALTVLDRRARRAGVAISGAPRLRAY